MKRTKNTTYKISPCGIFEEIKTLYKMLITLAYNFLECTIFNKLHLLKNILSNC